LAIFSKKTRTDLRGESTRRPLEEVTKRRGGWRRLGGRRGWRQVTFYRGGGECECREMENDPPYLTTITGSREMLRVSEFKQQKEGEKKM